MWIIWIVFMRLLTVNDLAAGYSCQDNRKIFSSRTQGVIHDGEGKYLPNQRCEWLIQSPNATALPFISLEFQSTVTECGYDFIIIYDGDSNRAPILATLSGDIKNSVTGKQVVAKNGKMLIQLISDINTVFEGFNATFNIYACYNNCSGNGVCVNNKCACANGWTGNDCSQHNCSQNCGAYGLCRPETEYTKCSCPRRFIGKNCQVDLSSNQNLNFWSTVHDQPGEYGSEGRAGHSGCFISPYYYIFGGYNLKRPLTKLLRYNFATNGWLLLESSTQPSARFYHSMSVVSHRSIASYLFLYGGEIEKNKLSDETWMYNTWSDTWTKHIPLERPDNPPRLSQHSSTTVKWENKLYIYIFGGRISNSFDIGLYDGMYRFDFFEREWQKIDYDPSGIGRSKLRIAGHSMVYDSFDESLVLFGGFRMDSDDKAALSSAILLYSLRYNRWSEVKKSMRSDSYHIEPLGYHTANIVGDYMIIHGGKKDGHQSRRCFNRGTHFYNLRCHSWIKELSRKAAQSPRKLFGHTADVINNKVLIVHGGYYGMMTGDLRAYKLPDLKVGLCESYKNRFDCVLKSVCIWTGRRCEMADNQLPICGSICPLLDDCLSCTSHNSFSYNTTTGWIPTRCAWCVQDSTCYAANGKEIDNCGVVSSQKFGVPWWNDNDTTILRDPANCLAKNIRPGVVMTEYKDIPNFSFPDNASYLREVTIHDKKLVKIAGFLRVNQRAEKFLQMRMTMVKGNAEIKLSSGTAPAHATSICRLNPVDGVLRKTSDVISMLDLQDQRYYIEMVFNHSIKSSALMGVEVAFSNSKETLNTFLPLAYTYLEPYQSAVTFKTSIVSSCNALPNCLLCLTDASCAWCNALSTCVEKSLMKDGPWCSSNQYPVRLSLSGIIQDFQFCDLCSDYITCKDCLQQVNCQWDSNKGKCLRKGRLRNLISTAEECPALCSEYRDCKSCVTARDKGGTATRCSWCVEKQICYHSMRHHLSAYTFGQCAFWVDDKKECPICHVHRDCASCLLTYECGWCSLESNPLVGYCSRGSFMQPYMSCDLSQLPVAYNDTKGMLWSYSTCPDVDECFLKEWPVGNRLSFCHANATCINTVGSYTCECDRGFEGDGRFCEKYCFANCGNGHCSGPPDYQCICDLGWRSSDLTNLTACDVDCGCNYLSYCEVKQGVCDACMKNSTGSKCEDCMFGYYHLGASLGCAPCECNGHGNADLGYCDQYSGVCFCQGHTTGKQCQLCEEGYFGNAHNGGICYRKCARGIQLAGNSGAFSSWQTSEVSVGSVLRKSLSGIEAFVVLCEWIIKSTEPMAIMLTLEKDFLVPCHISQVLVYDGGSSGGKLLGQFCGTDLKSDIILYALSGSVTIRHKNIFRFGLSYSDGFSAQYQTLPICSNASLDYSNLYVEEYSRKNCCQLHNISCFCGSDCPVSESYNSDNSVIALEWQQADADTSSSFPPPRTGSIMVSLSDSLWIFGGIDQSGPMGDFWRYVPTTKSWVNSTPNDESHPPPLYHHCAVSHPKQEKFFVYGGVLQSLQTSAELRSFAPDHGWTQLDNLELPSLAGHTMTFCGGLSIVIIGGYSSDTGFNDQIWTYDTERGTAVYHPLHGILPKMYGHTAVCDEKEKRIFIFGGKRMKDHSTSRYLYCLSLETWTVNPMGESYPYQVKPTAFHSAFGVFDVEFSGMFTTIAGDMTSELWFYHYATLAWIKISTNDTRSLIPLSSVTATINGTRHFFGGMHNGKLTNSIMALSASVTPCPSSQSNHSCHGSEDACKSFYSVCRRRSSSGVGSRIVKYVPNGCSYLSDCKECLSQSSLCHWCKSSLDLKSECKLLQQSCPPNSTNKKECDECSGLSYHHCSDSEKCYWGKSETRDQNYNKQVQRCTCKTAALDTSLRSKWDLVSAVDECPSNCSVFTSCKSCLQVGSNDDPWRDCVWLAGENICLDPEYVPLVCPLGGDCFELFNKGEASCPVKNCSAMRFCLECNQQPDCYWIEDNGKSFCRAEFYSKDSYKFLPRRNFTCPHVDECANGWHNCLTDDENNEICEDLDEGYQCICKEGYKRTFPTQPCKPECKMGCNHGDCVNPEVCECHFGYVGLACNVSCKCNGHSDCTEENPYRCLKCHHNTAGNQCQSCEVGFVGDPTVPNKACEPCEIHCNNKSRDCISKSRTLSNIGPTPDEVKCRNCSGHTEGDTCNECLAGYFKLEEQCVECQCNGHSDTCDKETGRYCKCTNHTTSSDERCNSAGSNSGNCWDKQCDKCEASYVGQPTNGGLCYRHMTTGQGMCLNAKQPMECPSYTFDINSNDILQRSVLRPGRTVLYAISPRITNLDVTIILDITYGKLALFLSDDMNYFRIVRKENSHDHDVIPDERYHKSRSKRVAKDNQLDGSSFQGENSEKNRTLQKYLKVDAEQSLNSFITYRPNTALRVNEIQNRLVITIPHRQFNLKLARFYVILLSVEESLNSTNISKARKNFRNDNIKNYVGSVAQLIFRQDRKEMNLFVFFSVFFSCFVVLLEIAVIGLKIKRAVNAQRDQRERTIQMEHMAKRPFAVADIILTDRSIHARKPLKHRRNIPIKSCLSQKKRFQVEQVLTPLSTDSCCRSDYESSQRSKSYVIIVHREQESGSNDVPLLNSTAMYAEDGNTETSFTESRKDITPIKTTNVKQKSTFGVKIHKKPSVSWGRTSFRSVRNSEPDVEAQEVPCIACEFTKSHYSVSTVLLQLPGPRRLPTVLCLGTTLLSTQGSSSTTL